MSKRPKQIDQMGLFDPVRARPGWNDLPPAVREALRVLLEAMLKGADHVGKPGRDDSEGHDE